MLTKIEIDAIVERILKRIRPQRVIIFGFYAKGTAAVGSDLDIFIIQETHLPMAERAHDLLTILSHSLIPIDVHIYTPEEVEEYGREPFSFVNSILKTGKAFFQRDGRIL